MKCKCGNKIDIKLKTNRKRMQRPNNNNHHHHSPMQQMQLNFLSPNKK